MNKKDIEIVNLRKRSQTTFNEASRKYEKTDFYNPKKSKPIHPLLKNQEVVSKKGQLIITTQIPAKYKGFKNKPIYFMDIGEKNLVQYNLKP